MSLPATGPITTAQRHTLTKTEELRIQNLSTAPLYVRLGLGATSSAFHFALQGGGVNDDGTGGAIVIDRFDGVVTVASTAVRYSAVKSKRGAKL